MDDAVVFDAEPLIAYYWDEPGSDIVDEWLENLEAGTLDGAVNTVTCTEVRYVCGRDDPEQAQAYVERLRHWFTVVDAETVWEEAAYYKRNYGIALGDAFTVATAEIRDATAVVGADNDFDDITEVPIKRFREESA